jgi:DNA-binding transcriptional regulator YiaG
MKCGKAGLKTQVPSSYHYQISGLDNVYLKGGVTLSVCPECGARSTTIKNLPGLHRVIANSIALAKRRLTGSELRFLREQLAFSAEEFGKLVDFNEDTIRKIEAGTQTPKAPYELSLRLAILNEQEAPTYDLHQFTERKEYEIEELKFVSKNRTWAILKGA